MLPLLHLIAFLLLLSLGIAAVSLAPWMPISKKDLPRLVRLAALKPGEKFYDLGCGDGRTVLAMAEGTPGLAVGVELAFPLYALCRLRQLLRRSKARFYWRDLFKINLADADVIYAFGMPRTLATRFKKKIEAECRPGTRIISYVFPVEGWTPLVKDQPRPIDAVLYLYQRS